MQIQSLFTGAQIIKNTPLRFPEGVSNLARDWVTAALAFDASKRASVAALLTHPWIATYGTKPEGSPAPSPSRDPSFTESTRPLNRRLGHDWNGSDKVCYCMQCVSLCYRYVLLCSPLYAAQGVAGASMVFVHALKHTSENMRVNSC